jgi:hypothetical protein
MRWLLVGYMFLFIDRPFEVWPVLGDWHIERAYMILTLIAWVFAPDKRFPTNPFHLALAAFAAAVVGSWAMSPWAEAGQPRVEDWLKILVFYGLVVTTVHDERDYRTLVIGFLTVMALYLLHSFKEYLGGRHTYRMGIARMIGVDSSLGDPNSFGATIVFSLPFVTAFWKSEVGGKLGKWALAGYFGLAVLCLLLTGSRSSLLGLVLWSVGTVFMSSRRRLLIPALLVGAPIAFMALPDSLQNRFETIINPDVGPENAKTSGEGRIEGLFKGVELWGQYPLTGAGPGAWRPATKSGIESHSLYGQLAGELGLAGVMTFGGLLLAYVINLRHLRAEREWATDAPTDFVFLTARAVGVGVILLLFMGLFGHNLFRFSWLWYGAYLVVARGVIARREMESNVTAIASYRAPWDGRDDEPIVVELVEA